MNQKSWLEEVCEAYRFKVIFFPKYHPKLNFIKQCWGYAKWLYCMMPPSGRDIDLERNMLLSHSQACAGTVLDKTVAMFCTFTKIML
jgi:hypothetical protein